MDRTFNSLKEVYESCKDLVTGEFKYLEENEDRENPCIAWQVFEDLSVYIEGDYFMIARGNTEVYSDLLDANDYLKIYNFIMEYDAEFRRNPEYGKNYNKKVNNLIYIVLGMFLITLVTVVLLMNL